MMPTWPFFIAGAVLIVAVLILGKDDEFWDENDE